MTYPLAIFEQLLDDSERSLSRILDKVPTVSESMDITLVIDLFFDLEVHIAVYSTFNTRLAHQKRITGCISQIIELDRKLLSLTHKTFPDALNLLDVQLMKLEGDDASNLVVLEPSVTAAKFQNACVIHTDCNTHNILQCFVFRKRSPEDRRKTVLESKLCFMCLGRHFAGNCPNPISCDVCGKKHNTLIHCPSKRSCSAGYSNTAAIARSKQSRPKTLKCQ